MRKLENAHIGGVYCVVVHADCVVTAGYDKNIYVWNLRCDDERNVSTSPRFQLIGHTHIIAKNCLAIFGDQIISGSWDCTIKVWDLRHGVLIDTLTLHKSRIKCIAVQKSKCIPSTPSSSNPSIMLSSSEDYMVIVWNLLDYTSLQKIRLEKTIVDIAFSFDSHTVAMLDSSKSVHLLPLWFNNEEVLEDDSDHPLFDVKNLKTLGRLTSCASSITCICFVAEDELMCGTSEGQILHINCTSGELIKSYPAHNNTIACILLHGSSLYTCDLSGTIYLCDVSTMNGCRVSAPSYSTIQTLDDMRVFSCSVDTSAISMMNDTDPPPSPSPSTAAVLLATVGDDGYVGFHILNPSTELNSSKAMKFLQTKSNNTSPRITKPRGFLATVNNSTGCMESTPDVEESPSNASTNNVEDSQDTVHPSLCKDYIPPSPLCNDIDDDVSIDSIVSEISIKPKKYLPKISLDVKAMKHLDNHNEDRRKPLVKHTRSEKSHLHALAMQKCLPSMHLSLKPVIKYDRRLDVIEKASRGRDNIKRLGKLNIMPPSLSSSTLHLAEPVHILRTSAILATRNAKRGPTRGRRRKKKELTAT